jgi:hypothetical protein
MHSEPFNYSSIGVGTIKRYAVTVINIFRLARALVRLTLGDIQSD